MPYLVCSNCGASVAADYSGVPAQTCPECCARMHPTDAGAKGPAPSIRMSLDAGENAPASARRSLERLGDQVDRETLEVAQLLTSELVTNCVRHAGIDNGAQGSMTVWLARRRLRVEVDDTGPGFRHDGEALPQPRGADGGWGLYVVDKFADRWGTEQGPGGRVWFELGLPQQRPTAVA